MTEKMIQLGLIGYPLAHSFSKRLHEQALRCTGLDGRYDLWEIPPSTAGNKMIRSKVEAIRTGEILGLNVTIPHKERIIPYLDSLTSAASSIGAVNTVYWDSKREKVMGDNTDAPAFWVDLKPIILSGEGPGKALVLGAGGAARAVTYQLLVQDWTVDMAARRISQAISISRHYKAQFGELVCVRLTNQSQLDTEPYRLIVNATSAGMYPDIEDSPWPTDWQFPSSGVVYDLVYNPPYTSFGNQARKAGLRTKNGLGMLIEQAALAFERWTGKSAPRREMRRVVTGNQINI